MFNRFIILCLIPICACSTPEPLSVVSPRPPLPANLIQPCQRLTPLLDGAASSILNKIIEVSQLYYECSRKQEKLIEAVK